MRNSRALSARDDFDDGYARKPKRRSFARALFGMILPHRVSDTIALAVATAASLAVVVNAVAFQELPRSTFDAVAPQTDQINQKLKNLPAAPNPHPRPQEAPARSMNDLIQNIQRELTTRGYYDGAIDGQNGPRTELAIRDFQKSNGTNTLEASDTLLAQIKNAPAKSEITGSINAAPDGERKSLRVLSLQRTLARLGYGPIRMTGTFGPDTKAAIERFERDWMMPVTGLMSENVLTKLAAVNGAPID
jgi:peptidoglycan hydrolase-like protein with peptidoglycan-binding domain